MLKYILLQKQAWFLITMINSNLYQISERLVLNPIYNSKGSVKFQIEKDTAGTI
jgi:hypothetical protein